MSSSKHKGAHVLVKNPFPEQLMSAKSSMASKHDISKKQMSFENTNSDLDILDQFLNPAKQVEKPVVKIDPTLKKEVPHEDFGKRIFPSHSEVIFDKKTPAVATYEDKLSLFNQDFSIPNLPIGSKLEFNILTTWGDMNYVGLTGIEIFDKNGLSLKIQDT